MQFKGRFFLALAFLLFAAGCSSTPPDSSARDAFTAWAKQNGFSYQNLRLGSIQRDGQIVEVPVIAELRKADTDVWVEEQAREDCRPEGSGWHCEQAINPAPTARGAATATAVAVAGAEAQLKNLRDMGWITFTSQRGGNGDIYVMRPDGSDLKQLTNSPADDSWPTWSPDGKRIAFASKRSGNYEIYIMNADGSSVAQLTSDAADDIQPSWSPDGKRLAFASKRTGTFGIYVMDSDGKNVKALQTGKTGYNPAWSPDGKQIAFWTGGISVMDVDGQNVREIASSAFSSSPPAWSPDGSRIAFAAFFGGGAPEIDLAAADGSARDRFRFAATGPAWSPDGAWIAFASGGRLYVSDVGANVLLQISDDGREPSWIK